ncbi:hypothetical protein GCM10010483_16910 [Actinokineospora diospyrosa]
MRLVLGGDGGDPDPVEVDRGDGGALGGQRGDHSGPDALARAGDHGDPVTEAGWVTGHQWAPGDNGTAAARCAMADPLWRRATPVITGSGDHRVIRLA